MIAFPKRGSCTINDSDRTRGDENVHEQTGRRDSLSPKGKLVRAYDTKESYRTTSSDSRTSSTNPTYGVIPAVKRFASSISISLSDKNQSYPFDHYEWYTNRWGVAWKIVQSKKKAVFVQWKLQQRNCCEQVLCRDVEDSWIMWCFSSGWGFVSAPALETVCPTSVQRLTARPKIERRFFPTGLDDA